MDNLGYLIAAYLIVWIALFAYLFWMGGVTRGLRLELRELRDLLSERERQATDDAITPAPVAELGSR